MPNTYLVKNFGQYNFRHARQILAGTPNPAALITDAERAAAGLAYLHSTRSRRYRLVCDPWDGQAKGNKAQAHGWLQAILQLAPHNEAGLGVNLCPWADGCQDTCLSTAGRNGTTPAARARILRAWAWYYHPELFARTLTADLTMLELDAELGGLRPLFRPNGLTDHLNARQYASERPSLTVSDYTKSAARVLQWLRQGPANLWMTYSASGPDDPNAAAILDAGGNVAAVFDGPAPAACTVVTAWGRRVPVIDGDAHDVRPLDGRRPGGQLVWLQAKGAAKRGGSLVMPPDWGEAAGMVWGTADHA